MEKSLKHSNNAVVKKVGDVSEDTVVLVPFTLPKNFLYKTCHTLGHDLKSPLFVVRSYAQLLQRSDDKDHLKRGLTLMNEASYKMENIINGFVELMDIYTIPYVEVQTFATAEFMQQIRCQLSPTHNRFDQSLTEDFTVENIKFNEAHLTTVVKSLLDNAFKHNKDIEDLKVKISTKHLRGNKVALIIEDNGVGMDLTKQGNKDKIKQPFYRPNKNEAGVGMGLAKVSAIANMTDSGFIIDSKIGQGTKCTFIF